MAVIFNNTIFEPTVNIWMMQAFHRALQQSAYLGFRNRINPSGIQMIHINVQTDAYTCQLDHADCDYARAWKML